MLDPVTIAAAAPSFFSGINPTGLISAGASLLGGLFGNEASRKSANAAQDFSADQFATRYQTTVKDMMAAGLSPMLAYSQGGGSPPTGVSYQAQNPAANVGSAYQSGAYASQAQQKLGYEQDLMTAQGNSAQSVADLNSKQMRQVEATISKIEEETKNLTTDRERIIATVKMLGEQTSLMNAQGKSAAEQMKVFVATVGKIESEKTLLGFDISAAKSMGNLGRDMGQLKPLFDLLLRVLRR